MIINGIRLHLWCNGCGYPTRKLGVTITIMDKKKAILTLRGESIPCRSGTPLWKAMKENNILVSAHLAIRNGTMITDDEMIKLGDVIELIPVISGG